MFGEDIAFVRQNPGRGARFTNGFGHNGRVLVESVPNFSEGRDRTVVEAIAAAISSVAGATVLDVTMDPDHNRSVITFAGAPESVLEASISAAGKAKELIDLSRHRGVHPRIGAIDVLPMVPLRGATMDDCVLLARRTAQCIWERHGIPAYLYEFAALRATHRNLADVRRGHLVPDVGGPEHHPTAGAVAVGARKFLIAFNVNLESTDLAAAREIARAVREATGGLPGVKALGLELASEGIVQVSMNLTDFETTPISAAFDAVRDQAAGRGIAVKESELVGLAPAAALDESVARRVLLRGFHPGMILENRLGTLH